MHHRASTEIPPQQGRHCAFGTTPAICTRQLDCTLYFESPIPFFRGADIVGLQLGNPRIR